MTETRLETRRFKAGEDLFREGEEGHDAFLIREGYVAVWRMQEGRRISLGTRSEGEVVGEMALIDETVCSATVTAGSDVEVQVVTKEELEAALAGSPDVVSTILYQLLESLRTANDLIAMYATKLEELTAGRKQ